ncbi:MAG: redoxin domain-containing protein [Planctomycetota bacterium]
MHAFLICLVVSLLGAAGLHAQIEVGAVAPEIPKTQWLNSEKPLSLEEFRGRVIVLFFWPAEETERLLYKSTFIETWRPIEDSNALYFIISDDTAEAIAPFLEAKEIPIATATSSTANQLYLPGPEPFAFIVGWDGRIAWRGSPYSKDIRKALQDEWLLARKLDKTWDPRPLFSDPCWDDFLHACLDDKLQKADKALDKLTKHEHKGVARYAGKLKQSLRVRVKDRVAYAKQIARQGRAQEAILLLEESVKLYKGFETAKELKADIKSIKSAGKSVLGLDKKRVRALTKAFRGDRSGALKDLVALQARAEGSRLENIVKAEIGFVKSMGVIVEDK